MSETRGISLRNRERAHLSVPPWPLSTASGTPSLMPILSPPCGTGYTPRAYTNDLKDVVEENLEEIE